MSYKSTLISLLINKQPITLVEGQHTKADAWKAAFCFGPFIGFFFYFVPFIGMAAVLSLIFGNMTIVITMLGSPYLYLVVCILGLWQQAKMEFSQISKESVVLDIPNKILRHDSTDTYGKVDDRVIPFDQLMLVCLYFDGGGENTPFFDLRVGCRPMLSEPTTVNRDFGTLVYRESPLSNKACKASIKEVAKAFTTSTGIKCYDFSQGNL